MNAAEVAGGRRVSLTRVIVAASYATLGVLLLWSRLYELGRGAYCCDEILTLESYVREGPREILAGAYVPNNHQLFSMVGWATSLVAGDSELVLRLAAALPFIAGVVIVTLWLHARLGAASGIAFLFLATVSPLLLDLSRQARGYGLAFLAMSLLVVGALEMLRSDRAWPVVAVGAGGVIGIWTLPHFAVAFLAVVAVLLSIQARRRQVLVATAAAVAAGAAWYAPHVGDILESSEQEYAVQIQAAWAVTAPVDQTLVPAFSLLADDYLHPNAASLALVILFVVVLLPSPLLRERRAALILAAPVVATVAVFWLTATHAAPRFFSFLLVPLLVLVATGAATTLGRVTISPGPAIQGICAVSLLLVIALGAIPFLAGIPLQPREAMREVAREIDAQAAEAPVFAYVYHPGDLEYWLGRRVAMVRSSADLARACAQSKPAVFVSEIWLLEPASPPCLRRAGTRHVRFEQYARGGEIDLWLIPPRGATT